ncbi:hypothetical protein HMPREF2869_10300 [Lactobacillus sp. HMSC061B07]|nr:hypothetical protein HMPREF2869_10300 [Lactobacillus sp. HMSC061B07]
MLKCPSPVIINGIRVDFLTIGRDQWRTLRLFWSALILGADLFLSEREPARLGIGSVSGLNRDGRALAIALKVLTRRFLRR